MNPFFLRGEEPGVRGPRDPFAVPERETAYPEPSMFGLLPAYGLYVRHVRGLSVSEVQFELMEADGRPAVTLDSASDVRFGNFRADFPAGAPVLEDAGRRLLIQVRRRSRWQLRRAQVRPGRVRRL